MVASFYDPLIALVTAMPNLILPIPVTYESVTRHVVQSVLDRVKRLTGIPADVPVRFPGSLPTMSQNGVTVTPGEQNSFDHSSKLQITVREEYNEESSISSPVRHHDMRYIFHDAPLDIRLKPIYSYTNTTIEVAYRARTRSQAERWRDDIRVRLSDNRQSHLHELSYHYPLPKSALVILHHLHTLRERQGGYGESFTQWMRKCLTPHATTLTTLAGTEPLLVIRERQVGVQGWFEFIDPPEAEKDSDGAAWTINFTYRFSYQKPVSTNLRYPLVVHNQFIDHRFYSDKPIYRLARETLLPGEQRTLFNHLEDMYEKPVDPLTGNRYPVFDEWLPRIVPPNTGTVANWMIGLDTSDPSLIVDLKDLGDHELVPIFRTFLRDEAPYLTRRGESLVYFTLFKGDEPMDDYTLTIGSDLVVRSNVPLSLRDEFHLRMSFITELSLLTERARQAILDHGLAAVLCFQTMINELDADYGFRDLIDWEQLLKDWGGEFIPGWIEDFLQWAADNNRNGTMSSKYLEWLDNLLRDRYSKYIQKSRDQIEWPLVGIVTVIADNES